MTLPAPPAPLANLLRRLPVQPPSWAFARLANRSVWPSLAGGIDPDLYGVPVCIEISDWGLRLHFRLGERGFAAFAADEPKVRFSASAEDLLRLALREDDPDTLFFNRRLRIEGDTDLGLRLKNMLDGIDLDAVLGTLPAPVVGLLRRLAQRPAARVVA